MGAVVMLQRIKMPIYNFDANSLTNNGSDRIEQNLSFAYYASNMLNVYSYLLCLKLCGHNSHTPKGQHMYIKLNSWLISYYICAYTYM